MLKERDTHIEKTGWKELGWFFGLWALGFGTIMIVGTLIKIVIGT